MKGIGKKLMALTLSLIMTVSMAVIPANAEKIPNDNNVSAVPEMIPTAEANNSFGSMLSDQVNDVLETTNSNNTEYMITDVVISDKVATVSYAAVEDCLIVVSLYDENTNEMIATGNVDAECSEDITTVEVDLSAYDIPEFFVLKAFILDYENNPLNDNYVSAYYTSGIQEVVDLSADDFNQDKVLNLDDKNDTNFAVYNDSTISIPYVEGENIPNTTFSGNGIYVFSNANEYIKNLKVGDAISYLYNNEVILIKVKEIAVDGNTVTITDEDNADMENFFDYVKIDNESKPDDIEYSSEGADDFVELIDDEDSESNLPESSGAIDPTIDFEGEFTYDTLTKTDLKYTTLKFKIKPKNSLLGDEDVEHPKDDQSVINANIKLSGEFTLKINMDCKFYYNASWNPISNVKELKNAYVKIGFDTAFGFKGGVTEKFEVKSIALGRLDFSPIPGVFIKLAPRFKFSMSAAVNISCAAKKYVGFEWSYDQGINNLCQPIKTSISLQFEGKMYAGLDLGPDIYLINEKLFEVTTTIEPGITLTAKDDILGYENTVKHDCKSCISGDLKFGMKLGIGIKFLNLKNLSAEKSFNVIDAKIADFYYSETFKDGGMKKCPHKRYKVEIAAKLDGSKAADRTIYAAKAGEDFEEIGKTSSDGKLTVFLAEGDYYIGFSKDKGLCDFVTVKKDANSAETERSTLTVIVCDISGNPLKNKTIKYELVGNGGEAVYSTTNDEGKCEILVPVGSASITVDGKTEFINIEHGAKEVTITVSSSSDGGNSDNDSDSTSTHDQDTTPVVENGECCEEGDNVKWELHESGTLYIYGEGKMKNYTTSGSDFYGSATIIKVIIENGVTSIGDCAFDCCTSLKSVTIPDSVTSIGEAAFQYCESLTSVIIPNSMRSIGSWAFYACLSLTSVTIPDSVTIIKDHAFDSCTSLTSVTIGDSVTSISNETFFDCSSLTSVTIPDSVTHIGEFAFGCCSKLKDIYYTGTEEHWKEISIEKVNDPLISATIHFNSKMPETSASTLQSISGVVVKTAVSTEAVLKNYSALVPNGRYIFMLVRDENSKKLIVSENLVYIDQFATDENGKLTVEYPDTYGNEYTALIFGGRTTINKQEETDTPDEPAGDTDTETDTDTSTDVASDTDSDTSTEIASDSETKPDQLSEQEYKQLLIDLLIENEHKEAVDEPNSWADFAWGDNAGKWDDSVTKYGRTEDGRYPSMYFLDIDNDGYKEFIINDDGWEASIDNAIWIYDIVDGKLDVSYAGMSGRSLDIYSENGEYLVLTTYKEPYFDMMYEMSENVSVDYEAVLEKNSQNSDYMLYSLKNVARSVVSNEGDKNKEHYYKYETVVDSSSDYSYDKAVEITEDEYKKLKSDLIGNKTKAVLNYDLIQAKDYSQLTEQEKRETLSEAYDSSKITIPDQDNCLLGDLDFDGSITSADALATLRISVGLESSDGSTKLIADVDDDSSITSADALEILRCSVGLSKTLGSKYVDNPTISEESDTDTDSAANIDSDSDENTDTDTEKNTDSDSDVSTDSDSETPTERILYHSGDSVRADIKVGNLKVDNNDAKFGSIVYTLNYNGVALRTKSSWSRITTNSFFANEDKENEIKFSIMIAEGVAGFSDDKESVITAEFEVVNDTDDLGLSGNCSSLYAIYNDDAYEILSDNQAVDIYTELLTEVECPHVDETMSDVDTDSEEKLTVTLDKNEVELLEGETVKLNYTINPSNYPGITSITWTSGDTTVASVNNEGIVTACSEGNTVITLSVEGREQRPNGVSGFKRLIQCLVNVKNTKNDECNGEYDGTDYEYVLEDDGTAVLAQIDDSVFDLGYEITSIIVPTEINGIKVSSFAGAMFSYWPSLEKITIPKDVKIGAGAFEECPKLTVYCYAGSDAERYVLEHGIDYVIIDE